MSTPTTINTFSAPGGKHGTAKQWLQRHLRKLPPIQPSNDEGSNGLHERASVMRPRTAPSGGVARDIGTTPAVPAIPVGTQPQIHTCTIHPPPHSPRPNSGVMRDVNAWLDASIAPSSIPLMGGVSYWRKAMVANTRDTVGIQHAISIEREPVDNRPSTSQSQQGKLFLRRAKKIQVQLPLRVCNKSLRKAHRKELNRRSNSMPVFAIPYEATQQAAPPTMLTRYKSELNHTVENLPANVLRIPNERLLVNELLPEATRLRHGTSAGTRMNEAEGSMERRTNTFFGRSTTSAESIRPSTTAVHIVREDSMGDFSDAPTYFTGLPPPSYRSRPASVLTTSSFGCIDGMNPEQRRASQQRAAMQRGMRCKLKKFAQSMKA
jgi:hypothetical protein